MKVTKDGFVWKLVSEEAKDIWNNGLFPLYELHKDGSESLIDSFEALDEARGNGAHIGIEVGHLFPDNSFKDELKEKIVNFTCGEATNQELVAALLVGEVGRNFLSSDAKTAVNSYGVIFNVGDRVGHDGAYEKATIESFELWQEDNSVKAITTEYWGRIDFMYHPKD